MRFLILVLVLTVVVLSGCTPMVFGVPKEEWDRLSEHERQLVIQSYNERQRLRQEQRLHEARRDAYEAERKALEAEQIAERAEREAAEAEARARRAEALALAARRRAHGRHDVVVHPAENRKRPGREAPVHAHSHNRLKQAEQELAQAERELQEARHKLDEARKRAVEARKKLNQANAPQRQPVAKGAMMKALPAAYQKAVENEMREAERATRIAQERVDRASARHAAAEERLRTVGRESAQAKAPRPHAEEAVPAQQKADRVDPRHSHRAQSLDRHGDGTNSGAVSEPVSGSAPLSPAEVEVRKAEAAYLESKRQSEQARQRAVEARAQAKAAKDTAKNARKEEQNAEKRLKQHQDNGAEVSQERR